LWVRPPLLSDVPWTPIGHANDVRSMAASGGTLYCRTGDGGLWRRDPVLSDINWQPVGTAPDVDALAATTEGLFAATTGDRLVMRSLP
jgi:hypothetical protein